MSCQSHRWQVSQAREGRRGAEQSEHGCSSERLDLQTRHRALGGAAVWRGLSGLGKIMAIGACVPQMASSTRASESPVTLRRSCRQGPASGGPALTSASAGMAGASLGSCMEPEFPHCCLGQMRGALPQGDSRSKRAAVGLGLHVRAQPPRLPVRAGSLSTVAQLGTPLSCRVDAGCLSRWVLAETHGAQWR